MSVFYSSPLPPAPSLLRPLKRKVALTRQSQTEQSGVPYPTPKQGKSGKSPWKKFLNKLFSSSSGKKVNKGLADPLRDDDPYQLLESEEHPDAVFFREIREKQRDASFLPKPAASSSALSTWAVMQEMLPRHVDRPEKFWNPGKSKDSDIMANPDVLLREYIYDPLNQKADLILESPPSSGNASFRAAWERMKNEEDDFLLPLDSEVSPVLPLQR